MNFQTICRICIRGNSEMSSIFESFDFSTRNRAIFEVITDCASVQIQRFDGFSEQICRRCLDHLSQAYSFKKLCEESDYKFRNGLILSDEIEIKAEFIQDDPKILHGEVANDITEKEYKINKITDLGLTNVNRESGRAEDPNVLCNKSLTITEDLALRMTFPVKQEPADLCEEPDYEFAADSSNEIEVKSEFFVEDTIIDYGEIHNEIGENGGAMAAVKIEQGNDPDQSDTWEKDASQPSNATFNSNENLKKSECKNGISTSSKSPYKCELCSKTFATKRNLTLHTKLHAEQRQRKCNVCSKQFSRSADLTHHMKTHPGACDEQETGENQFQCDICDETFSCKNRLVDHFELHTRERRFNCEICDKKFLRNNHLQQHMSYHTGEKPFKCDICDKKFYRNRELNKHYRVHTGERPFTCDVCGKSFSLSSGLNRHIRVHTGEKPFKCDICEQRFSSSEGRNRHIRVHTGEKPFKCDICDQNFPFKRNLQRHMSVHTGEKPFSCEICGKTFSFEARLKLHIRVHTGDNPFKCDICERRFSSNTELIRHIRVHTGEKPFKCDICDKKFAINAALVRHIRVHTGEKLFKCDICDKKFSTNRHIEVNMGGKPFTCKCDICEQKFSKKQNLKRRKSI